MRLAKKIWLIVAAALVFCGGILFVCGMSVQGWDFAALSTSQYETNEYTVQESFQHISVKTDTADLVFLPSDAEQISVTCFEQVNVKHIVTVRDDTLVIEAVDTRKWYEHIGLFFRNTSVTVYLPRGAYGALSVDSDTGDVDIPKDFSFTSMDISESTGDVTSYADVSGTVQIRTDTGDIRVEGASAGALDLSVSTGDVTVSEVLCEGDMRIRVSTGKTKLTGVTCAHFTSKGSTGDLSLQNVVATGGFSIERSTGDVKFSGCDAAEISVLTDTGDVTGTLLSEKVFITRTDTGDIRVPSSTTGGRCEITTDTGDIRISIVHGS